MGKLTRVSTSTAARPGALARTMTWVLVTSGKASMGRCVQATPPRDGERGGDDEDEEAVAEDPRDGAHVGP